MLRKFKSFPAENVEVLKQQMLSWGNQFNICCFMDNHNYDLPYHSYECLLAVGAASLFKPEANTFDSVSDYVNKSNDWIFGHFNYEFNSDLNDNRTTQDQINFPEAFLFVPEVVLLLTKEELLIGTIEHDPFLIHREILQQVVESENLPQIEIKERISRDEYLDIINQLKAHIRRGDCYEINFCQEFYAEKVVVEPVTVYNKLTEISPNPLSVYYRNNDNYLLCASPERYIKKTGEQIISQPIKGTIERSNDQKEDKHLKNQLFLSAKDRSENVMIVDLVRNDLSKVCKEGTIKVEDLFNVHPFPNVYQMISVITGLLRDDADFGEVLKATFPMGSMTGAPKKKVMDLINKYEPQKRGIFSGTVGYITPTKDYDFNVVIRSIMYNNANQYLSYQAGSGITFYSDPEKEYEECMLKVQAISKVLNSLNTTS